MRKITGTPKAPFPQPDVVTKGIPVPTDGWDAISPLADMDPKRAPILQNWVPRPGFVELRQGYSAWVQGISTGPVETLAVLRQPTSQRMFAASAGMIVEVTNQGSQPVLASGFASNRWQYTNFTPPNGTTVIQLVNGVDALQQYNGATWSSPSITGFPNGWSTVNIVNIFSAKQRLWYVMKNSTIVAFMPIGAIQGPIAGYQDFGTLWPKGGFAVAVFDWTIDGGEGPSSYVAFMSSEGQVALYQGVDPTNTSLWSLVGVFDLPPPIGFRCATKLGSDVAVITYQGLLPISQALPYDPSADRSAALTARIQNAMNLAVQNSKSNFGWQWIVYPAQTLGFLNVPIVENTTQTQYVMNMLTGAWCSFTNWNANCFELLNQQLFFGDNNGNVNLAYSGSADLVSAIPADMQCAFNWFDDPGRNKRMLMIQPLMTSDGQISPNIAIDVDFSNVAPSTTATTLNLGATWDNAIWDQDVWGGGLTQVTNWLGAVGEGHALAVRVGVSVVPVGPGGNSVFDKATFDLGIFDGVGPMPITLQVNAFNAIMELGGFI